MLNTTVKIQLWLAPDTSQLQANVSFRQKGDTFAFREFLPTTLVALSKHLTPKASLDQVIWLDGYPYRPQDTKDERCLPLGSLLSVIAVALQLHQRIPAGNIQITDLELNQAATLHLGIRPREYLLGPHQERTLTIESVRSNSMMHPLISATSQGLAFCPNCWHPGSPPDPMWLDSRAHYCFACGTKLQAQQKGSHEKQHSHR